MKNTKKNDIVIEKSIFERLMERQRSVGFCLRKTDDWQEMRPGYCTCEGKEWMSLFFSFPLQGEIFVNKQTEADMIPE